MRHYFSSTAKPALALVLFSDKTSRPVLCSSLSRHLRAFHEELTLMAVHTGPRSAEYVAFYASRQAGIDIELIEGDWRRALDRATHVLVLDDKSAQSREHLGMARRVSHQCQVVHETLPGIDAPRRFKGTAGDMMDIARGRFDKFRF